MFFSFHNGEFGEAGSSTARNRVDMEEPADFAVQFARAAIDALGSGVLLTARAECYLAGHPEPLRESLRRSMAVILPFRMM